MKKQIYDIVFATQYEGLSTKEATDKLLLLFGVSGRLEQIKCYHYNHEWKSDGRR